MKNQSDDAVGVVLIVAPVGKDAALAANVLEHAGIAARVCAKLSEVTAQLGDSTDAIVVAEEGLIAAEVAMLLDGLSQQPPWSDIPLIVLTSSGGGDDVSLRALEIFGPKANLTLVERPLRTLTLVSTLQVALRARRRQREVRDLIAQREAAFSSITDAFSAIDSDWRYTYVNDRAVEYAGIPRREMIGRSIWDVYPDARGGEFHQAADLARETRKAQTLERYHERWQCWLETHIYPVGTGGVVVFHANIDKRKAAEEALREKDLFVRLLLDSVAEGFYAVDRDGSTTVCNAAFLRMLGFERESDVIGKKLHDAIHHSHPDGSRYEKANCHIYLTAHTGQPAHVDDELFFRLDGTGFPVEYWAFPIIRDGELRGAVTTFIDITERRQAQIALQQAKQEAEDANRAKDQFLAMLSHELRTPLTPVLMTIASLQRQPDVSDELRADFEVLQRNVELEARLIDDLLDLTRIRHGKLELQFDAADVHTTIEHALTISAQEIQEKKLAVHLDLEAREHHCWADAARLQQVFWNLIKNAAKFTPAGGRLEISTRNDSAQRIVVRVSDNGIGIDPGLMPKIFDAFEQGGRQMTNRFGGLGLGLAISKRVIDLHEGMLTAESDGPGHGATFVITLTAMATSLLEGTTPYAPEEVSARSGTKILLVEDHEDTADVLQRMLRQSGYIVTRAANLAHARDAATRHCPDLVISDLALPDGSGLKLMQELRNRSEIKGISLSGFGTEDDIAASAAAGFSEHLTKPVDWLRLKTVVQRLTSASGDAAKRIPSRI